MHGYQASNATDLFNLTLGWEVTQQVFVNERAKKGANGSQKLHLGTTTPYQMMQLCRQTYPHVSANFGKKFGHQRSVATSIELRKLMAN